MPTYVIIGASRGIGLEIYLAEFIANGGRQNVHVLQADVVDDAAMKKAADNVSGIGNGAVDVLIHNASRQPHSTVHRGFFDYPDGGELDTDFLENFKANALGVVHSVNAFLPLLRKGSAKKIVVIGTSMGHLDFTWKLRIETGVAYGASKAAADLIVTKYAALLEDESFIVTGLLPGLVDTSATAIDAPDEETIKTLGRRMEKLKKANPNFDATPMKLEAGVHQLLEAIQSLTPADNGTLKFAGGHKF
ncbi:hypothetical protein IEO21_03734 [Rhodonia placenta]|uniref:NAD(P)-binding protein n=1 Tax=Rhodonia placenta TaxID=104341 RepID=A0A8H7P570_9APHY|nr:hypothetical protein IEO21_03734 [Postia placenta]